MKWQRGSREDNFEDIRGQAPRARARGGSALKLGGGGAAVAILVALVAQVLGVDVSGIFGAGGGGSAPSASGQSGRSQSTPATPSSASGGRVDPSKDPDNDLREFVKFVNNDVQDTFAKVFEREGKTYRFAKLVVFTDEVDTGCGLTSSAVGPFYCPPDEKAYIDFSFYRDLKARFGAPGDFAQAYVIAHEIGHHLQNVLGIDDKVRAMSRRDRSKENQYSVMQELQADCFAGVWAHEAKKSGLVEVGDPEEAINAASQIGDDRLQKRAGVPVNTETWTHGSSAQRVRWFGRGFEQGSLDVCDTFSAQDL